MSTSPFAVRGLLGFAGSGFLLVASCTPAISPDASSITTDASDARESGIAPPDGRDATDDFVDVDVVRPSCGPRLVAPVSTSRTASSRPLLRWSRGSSSGALHVDVCRDRACATIESTTDSDAESLRVATDLSPGAHFWRVRSDSAPADCEPASATWEFFVGHGRADAPEAGTLGLVPDLNGDGLADFSVSQGRLVGENTVDQVQPVLVFYGTPSGPPARPDIVLDRPSPEDLVYGNQFAYLGDLDADGFGEFAVSSCSSSAPGNRVSVYRGTPHGLDPLPAVQLYPPGENCSTPLVGPGDVNGDGYSDLLITVYPVMATLRHRVAVFYGGPHGPGRDPDAEIYAASREDLFVLDAPGDVNGDGFADVALTGIGGYDPAQSGTEIDVFQGSAGGLVLRTPPLVSRIDAHTCLTNAHGGVDYNGDGYADIVVAARGCGDTRPLRAWIYTGGPGGIVDIVAREIAFDAQFDGDVSAIASAGDMDGDGRDEIGLSYYDPAMHGIASRIAWGAAPTDAAPITETGLPVGITLAVACGRDVDGDGVSDFLAGGETTTPRNGSVFFYRGRAASGFPAMPDVVISNDMPSVDFGSRIAISRGRRRSNACSI